MTELKEQIAENIKREAESGEPMLVAKNVQKIYTHFENKIHVLNGIDLKISAGEVVAILGPSGAGKATLLRVLGGLDAPNSGSVVFEEQELYKLKEAKLARIRNENIGFIFQFYHLLPDFTALENVLLPALVKGDVGHNDALEAKALDLLGQVGLKNRQSHKPNQLSGGEQQRVAIARALVNDPRIIFCDEPTGNLDSQTGEQILDLLLKINRENKQTLVIVTHDERIAKHAKRVVHMQDGKII